MLTFSNIYTRWLAFAAFIPGLYFLGWVLVQILRVFGLDFFLERSDLFGTIISFFLFLLALPYWIKIRWGFRDTWKVLGVSGMFTKQGNYIFLRGILWSVSFLLLISFTLHTGGWLLWVNEFNSGEVINALLLLFGVGFAEELVFRGWLWGEMNHLIGPRWGGVIQASLFSIAHIRFDVGLFPMISLILGLFLLGIVLNFRRILDGGSLWGCVGLHGGLVSIWFLLNNCLYTLSKDTPSWLTGPDIEKLNNPLSGFLAIIVLAFIIVFQLNAVAKARSPFTGARNASSNGAIP